MLSSRRLLASIFAILCFLLGFNLLCRGATQAEVDATEQTLAPTVLLLSIDGFRWDYLERFEAPNLRRLASEGVYAAEGMIAVFPTKTFPNHYSIVTGLYPAHHGIISNTMYDPDLEAWFRLSDRDAVEDPRWWGGEPIWVTAEQQGVRSATYFWPGSEAPIQQTRPSDWKRYDGRVPGEQRVEEVLSWLDRPAETRPRLITLYFSQVDSDGHDFGPESPQAAEAVAAVDGYIGLLLDGLEQRGYADQINLIVVSDHGMADLSPERVIALDDYIDLDDVLIVERSPVLMLRPRAGKKDLVYEALKDAHPNLSMYRQEDLPARWHFQGHPRITPLVGVADEGWTIISERARRNPNRPTGGTHGYDNRLPSMRAFFAASGPAFKQGVQVEPFENIHLYNLMAFVLGLEAAPNDGDLEATASIRTATP